MEKKLKKFKVSFKPIPRERTYLVEADCEARAMDVAYEEHVQTIQKENSELLIGIFDHLREMVGRGDDIAKQLLEKFGEDKIIKLSRYPLHSTIDYCPLIEEKEVNTYQAMDENFPVDLAWSDEKKREYFIREIADLAFGEQAIERGWDMEEVLERLKKFSEFSLKWEEHSGEESL